MSAETFLNGRVSLCCGDSSHFLRDQPDNRYDSIVTDPPYALVSIVKRFGKEGSAPINNADEKMGRNGPYHRASKGFMGKTWDNGEIAFAADFWAECLRVLKPGGHVVAFSGTRTVHRLVCAIEDAGFEIRDMLSYLYGSGFPKSHDVSKGIDRAAGAEREVIRERYTALRIKPGATVVREGAYGKQDITFTATDTAPATDAAREWQGWGTSLKPACEMICLARKPLSEGTVAANVLRWGTGAINVDGCRVGTDGGARTEGGDARTESQPGAIGAYKSSPLVLGLGRWPANVIHDGSEEVVAAFPETDGVIGALRDPNGSMGYHGGAGGAYRKGEPDSGSAARFFYTTKADSDDRLGSKHPTVKPVDLMQWLVRLVTPKNGLVLDPFAGTGTTAEACYREGMRCMLIEREAEYQADIRRRMALVLSGPDERAWESSKAKMKDKPEDHGPLFAFSEAAQ